MSIRYSLSVLPVLLVTSTLVGHVPAVSAEPVYACASRYFGFMRLVKKPRCRRRERLVTFPGASGDGGGEGNAKLLARIAELESQNKALSTRIDDLQQDHQDDYLGLTDRLKGLQQADDTLRADVDALVTANDLLTAQVEGSTGGVQPIAPDKIACISDLSTATDLIFEGCNVHIRNRMGMTDSKDGSVGVGRGTGNLIIGYDEDGLGDKDRTGSHNVVVGGEHTYSSYGGLVAGYRNSLTGANASVTGGTFNEAQGSKTSVSGGYANVAIGDSSSVSGGAGNKTNGIQASVSGGLNNEALSDLSSVSGGAGNQAAMGRYSSVSGGFRNVAAGEGAIVSGGFQNTAWGTHSSVLGGQDNTAAGEKESMPTTP